MIEAAFDRSAALKTSRGYGRWMVRVNLGTVGTRRRKTAYAATQAGAIKMLKRLNGRAVDGQLLATSTRGPAPADCGSRQ